MFKVGDKVRCIDVAGNNGITLGRVYTVLMTSLDRVTPAIFLECNDLGTKSAFYYTKRFVLAKDEMKTTPHKHAELIKQWADNPDLKFQYRDNAGMWVDASHPMWTACTEYRIKPTPKPDVMWLGWVGKNPTNTHWQKSEGPGTGDANLRLTYDGETGKIKAVELLS